MPIKKIKLSLKVKLHLLSAAVISVAIVADAILHGLDYLKVMAYPVSVMGIESIERIAKIWKGGRHECDQ